MIAISFPLTADVSPHIRIVTAGPDMILSAAAAAADTASANITTPTATFEMSVAIIPHPLSETWKWSS